jgi:GNAT superfamily N-acetyltransferase
MTNNRLPLLRDWPRGALAAMLAECYAPLLRDVPEEISLQLRESWLEYDRAVHQAPSTVGACGFMTIVDDEAVGFASWDPRGWPEVGRVGHNCVRPLYQGRGYGRRQIAEILERFRARGFAKAEVRTDEHPFFEPARRAYASCGFHVAGHAAGLLMPNYRMIIYEAALGRCVYARVAERGRSDDETT